MPKPLTSGAKAEGRFGKQDFVYIVEDDEYRCPAGERLTWRFDNVEHGLTLRNYWASNCASCPMKPQCTIGKERRINGGSMKPSSMPCSSVWSKSRILCAFDDRRWSTRSAPSKPGWEQPTF